MLIMPEIAFTSFLNENGSWNFAAFTAWLIASPSKRSCENFPTFFHKLQLRLDLMKWRNYVREIRKTNEAGVGFQAEKLRQHSNAELVRPVVCSNHFGSVAFQAFFDSFEQNLGCSYGLPRSVVKQKLPVHKKILLHIASNTFRFLRKTGATVKREL